MTISQYMHVGWMEINLHKFDTKRAATTINVTYINIYF